jgi:hypothetical protein
MDDTANSVEQLEADLAQSRAETRSAFETRAYMYAYIYEELVGALGRDEAVAVMKRAIYRRGLEVGRKYRPAVEAADLIEVGSIFCSGSPCEGGLFEPSIETSSTGHIVLGMTACPLVEAWHGMGLPEAEVDTLCEIAAAVDEGTFAGAGLDLAFMSRIGTAGIGQCLLDLTLPTDE